MKGAFLILFFLLCSNAVFCQHDLKQEDIERLQHRGKEYVKNFEDFIVDISSTKTDEGKLAPIHSAYDLFESTATIEVSNRITNKRKKYSIKEYLMDVVRNYSNHYGAVVITYVNIVADWKNLQAIKDRNGEDIYVGSFSFKQCFCAGKNAILNSDIEKRNFEQCDAYKDCTKKRGEIIVRKVTTVKGERWILKLGNITVVETSDIK